ncbi:hypothetical protein EJB05_18695, partial [Eragrostis curvula]
MAYTLEYASSISYCAQGTVHHSLHSESYSTELLWGIEFTFVIWLISIISSASSHSAAIFDADDDMKRKPASLALFLTEASCCDFLQYAIAPWIGLSISELALLLLLSTGPTPESFELGMEKEDEFDEEHDDDEAEDVLFDDEYRITTLENDLLWPHSSSLILLPSVELLLMGEAMYLLLLIFPNGFFLHVLNCALESSFAPGLETEVEMPDELELFGPWLLLRGCRLIGNCNTTGDALMEVMLLIELTTDIT